MSGPAHVKMPETAGYEPMRPLEQPYCTIGGVGEVKRWPAAAAHYMLHTSVLAARHPCWYFGVDLLSSFVSTARVMITMDVALATLFTATSTCMYWVIDRDSASDMSWTAISFAVIFPITHGISFSFARREKALNELGTLVAHLSSIYSAAFTWVVPNKKDTGPKQVPVFQNYPDPAEKSEKLRVLYDALFVAIITYFDTERWGRSRHTVRCIGGQTEQRNLMALAHTSRLDVYRLLDRCMTINGTQSRRIPSLLLLLRSRVRVSDGAVFA